MTSKAMSEVGIAGSMAAAVFLGLMAAASLIMFMWFLDEGEFAMEATTTVCVIFFFILGFACFGPNVVNGLFMARSSSSPRVLRAAYFLIAYPVVFYSFMLATINAEFVPSVTFGWPLFLLGMVAYPWSALIVHNEVKDALLRTTIVVQCRRCHYLFRMHIEEEAMRCLYCGEVNANPHLAELRAHKARVEVVEEAPSGR